MDDSDEFAGTVPKGIIMRPALRRLGVIVSFEGGIVFHHVVCSIHQRIAQDFGSAFGHSGAFSLEVSGLIDGRVQTGECQQLHNNDAREYESFAALRTFPYFCSIIHELRNDMSYRIVVDELIQVPEATDTRDTEAIKRIASVCLKLLLPNRGFISRRHSLPAFFIDTGL